MTRLPRLPAEAGHGLVWSELVVSAAYVGSIVMANWASTRWAALLIGSLIVPAGTLWARMTLTLPDLLHEALGASGVVGAIAVAAWLSWSVASPPIAVASVAAFAVSECVDSLIYGRIRVRSQLGNGVVPQQTVHAVTLLLGDFLDAANGDTGRRAA